jgi:hypothetical protein
MAHDDNIQHGIDDNPHNDATKGAVAGALGGAAVGAAAGGPVGAIVGAVAGGVASGAGVAAVDQVDNDNTVTGLGDGATRDVEDQAAHAAHSASHSVNNAADTTANRIDNLDAPGNGIPGIQTGGQTTAGTDTRGITEKAADVLTGDRTDDKTGGRVL